MVEYSRTVSRLMVIWRWILFVFVALELHTPALTVYLDALGIHHSFKNAAAIENAFGPSFSPIAAIGLLGVWYAIATVLQFVMEPTSLRAIIVGLLDIGIGAFLVWTQRSLHCALVFGPPAVELFTLGPIGGLAGTLALCGLYPAMLASKFSPAVVDSPGMLWYYAYITFAGSCGYVLSSLLRQELQARALVSVIETSQKLGSSASIDKILSLVVKDVKQLFGCNTCVIYLKEMENPTEPMIRVAGAATPVPEAFTDFNPEQAHSIVGQVIKEKKGRVMDDFQHFQPEETIKKESLLRAAMVAPLMFEDDAIGAIYIAHSNPGVYTDSIFRLFAMLANQVALAVRNVQLHKTTATLAITDSLSGLFTHGYFQEHLGKEVIQSKYSKNPLSLMIIDVDFFKKVNDTYGHPQGDALLKQLGSVIKQVVRPSDVVCRYGGDEFTVTMLGTNRISAVVIAERIRQTVEDYEFVLGNQIVHVTVSGGVASFPEDAETKKELIEKSDAAMYESKHKGRNRICFSA